MKRSGWITLLIIIVIALGVGIYLITAANSTNRNSGNMGNMPMAASTAPTGQTPQATHTVTIRNFSFNPSDITVKNGTTVTWTNKDSVAHTVTETDNLNGPDSGTVNPGSSYSFTFSKTGTYHYHCAIHTQMLGTVTVTD